MIYIITKQEYLVSVFGTHCSVQYSTKLPIKESTRLAMRTSLNWISGIIYIKLINWNWNISKACVVWSALTFRHLELDSIYILRTLDLGLLSMKKMKETLSAW